MISKLSLKYRIAVVIFLLEGVMLTVVLWQTLGLSIRASSEHATLTQSMIVELVSDLSRSALLTNEYAELQLYLEHVQKEPTVEQIFIVNSQNLVLAGIPPEKVGTNLSSVIESETSPWQKKELKHV